MKIDKKMKLMLFGFYSLMFTLTFIFMIASGVVWVQVVSMFPLIGFIVTNIILGILLKDIIVIGEKNEKQNVREYKKVDYKKD